MADSPRPGVWSLEKSVDGGKTFTAWQYFAGNDAECQKYFGMHANMKIKNDDDVICVTEFSKVKLSRKNRAVFCQLLLLNLS